MISGEDQHMCIQKAKAYRPKGVRRERLIKSLPHSCHRVYLRNLRKAVWLHWDGAKPMCLAPLVLYFEYSIR